MQITKWSLTAISRSDTDLYPRSKRHTVSCSLQSTTVATGGLRVKGFPCWLAPDTKFPSLTEKAFSLLENHAPSQRFIGKVIGLAFVGLVGSRCGVASSAFILCVGALLATVVKMVHDTAVRHYVLSYERRSHLSYAYTPFGHYRYNRES
eukprot:scaffold126613_cov34-Attheya_sp.AAC.1